MSTEKKVAFITGGNRGLGKETARELAERGILVVIGARDVEKGEAVAKELRGRGFAAESVKCDMARREDFPKVYEYLAKKHGKLDILINNAGIRLDDGARASDLMKILRETFEVNFFAT